MAKPVGNLGVLLRVWGVLAFAFVILVLTAVESVLQGGSNRLLATVPWVVLALVIGFVLVARRYALRRFARDFLAPGPEALIERSQRTLSRARVPHARELLALGMASSRAYYGQFGRARDELDEIVWDGLPALYRGGALQIRALIHYLSGEDVQAGLRNAEQARELAQLPRFTPGARASARVSGTYVDIGRVLVEAPSAELSRELDARAASAATPQERMLTLWGAAIAYEKAGDAARAQALFAQLKGLAPHCAPLHASPAGCSVGPAAATAPEHGVCARHPQTAASGRCVRCGNFSCDACRHPISPAAAVCGECRDRYASLREANLRAETHLRAAGLLGQAVAIGIGLAGVAWLSWLALSGKLLVSSLLGAFGFAFMGGSAWWAASSLRRLELRAPMPYLLLLLIEIVPVGTLLGVYLLWLFYGPSGRLIRSLDYQRALAATLELQPRASRWTVGVLLGALIANVALFVALLIG